MNQEETKVSVDVLTGLSQDRCAMIKIHQTLDGEEWSADTLDIIAKIVTDTGRKIREPI